MSKVIIRYDAEVECDIDLTAIEKYLESKAWRDAGAYGKFARIFENDRYGETVTIPTTDRIADFNTRLSELVCTLASCEKRPVPDILAEMRS
jgi:hypothetical protein